MSSPKDKYAPCALCGAPLLCRFVRDATGEEVVVACLTHGHLCYRRDFICWCGAVTVQYACYLDAHGDERVGRQLTPHQCSWALSGVVVGMDRATSRVQIQLSPSLPPIAYTLALAAAQRVHSVVVGGPVYFNVSPQYPTIVVGIDFPTG